MLRAGTKHRNELWLCPFFPRICNLFIVRIMPLSLDGAVVPVKGVFLFICVLNKIRYPILSFNITRMVLELLALH